MDAGLDLVIDGCARWDFPLGPFFSPEDVEREMAELADHLGPDAAPALARCVVERARGSFEHLASLSEFAGLYLRRHPGPAVAALWACLDAAGPPVLVELLGASSTAGVSERLIATIPFESADVALQLAFLGALGELADAAAARFLAAVEPESLPPAVRHELEVARLDVARAGV